MKNKVLILALLAIFVSTSFIACGGDSPKMVKEVNVIPVGNDGYILKWDAVGKNVLEYEIFAKQKDKASIFRIATGLTDMLSPSGEFGTITNQMTFTVSGNNIMVSTNSDVDKWNAVILKENLVPVTGNYYFGIRTVSTTADYSNIRWSKDPYNLISIMPELIDYLY